jgi:phenylacetate-CoA ligase
MNDGRTIYPPVRHTSIPGMLWPALPPLEGLKLLALRYQLERSQWWPPEFIETQQFMQLEALLDHALGTVPYYRRKLAGMGHEPGEELTRPTWETLPLLTRTDIQGAGAELHSTHVPERHGRISKTSTSGSTGSPVTTLKTELEQDIYAAISLREALWHRPEASGKVAIIRRDRFNSSYDPNGHSTENWGLPVAALYKTGPSTLLDIFFEPPHQIDWLRREAPDYLLTLPSNLRAILLYARQHAITLPPLKHVRTYGEALGDDLRELTRAVWKTEIFDTYSAEEVGVIAVQCAHYQHYHVQSEALFVEILDAAGRPVRPGERGRVVLTTLHNFAMPLIRYAIGDYAEVGEACPCGRTLPVLTRILGRTRNMLVMPSGNRRFAVLPAKVVSKIPAIVQQQIVQTTRSDIEVRMIAKRPLTGEEQETLRDDLAAQLVEPFNISFVYVDEIPRSREGKYEDFRSEVDVA